MADPTYVNLGDHTESVDIDYDPTQTNYEELLEQFWSKHDPTSSCSKQYMSAIFYHNDKQRVLAEKSMEEEQKKYSVPLLTQIVPATIFYDAEDYHQKYLLKRNPFIVFMLNLGSEDLKHSTVAARLNGYLSGYGTIEAYEKEWRKLGLTEKQANTIRDKISTCTEITGGCAAF